jgi:hypothetical protein
VMGWAELSIGDLIYAGVELSDREEDAFEGFIYSFRPAMHYGCGCLIEIQK